MPDKDNNQLPNINSIADLISETRQKTNSLKKGKSSGITGDFGSADLLLSDIEPWKEPSPAFQYGQPLWNNQPSPEQLQHTVASVATLCESKPPQADNDPPGQIVGSCLYEGKRHDFRRPEPEQPPIEALLPAHPDSAVSSSALAALITAAQNNSTYQAQGGPSINNIPAQLEE